MNNDATIKLVSDDYLTQVKNLFYHNNVLDGKSSYREDISVNANYSDLYDFFLDLNFQVVSVLNRHSDAIAFSDALGLIVEMKNETWYHSLRIVANKKSMAYWLIGAIEEKFSSNPCFIDWVYDEKYYESIRLPLSTDHLPIDEMYPWLGKRTLSEYYDGFINSSSNILILIGPPGTGKTTAIRGLLAHSKKSATLTHSKKILSDDGFFVEWLQSKNDFLVIEDSDSLLIPRTEGNDMMSKFLNIGDGLMTVPNKKLIFSTNLKDISDIDTALTRPGRCYDITKFGELNPTEVQKLAEKTGITEYNHGVSLTISEVFSNIKKETRIQQKKLGFY